MSSAVESVPAVAVQQLAEWAQARAKPASVSTPLHTAPLQPLHPVDLRGPSADAAAALKAWVARSLHVHDANDLRLRPIAAVMASKSNGELDASNPADDSGSVISVARSFGLSTTTGARGDAVSYVLRAPAAADSGSATVPAVSPAVAGAKPAVQLLGVVKVIKSRNVFQQELSALQLIQSLLPSPTHAFYPRLLAAEWALIPTAIPAPLAGAAGVSSHASAFARPYSVSSMGSSSAPSTSSTCDSSYCQGGLVLMECAPGAPLSELFSRVGAEEPGSAERHARMDELVVALREAARALAELHVRTTVPGVASADAVRPFLADMAAQVRDMLGKLALPEYADSVRKWSIDVPLIGRRLDELLQLAVADPGECCLIHGDAHAGNMLWDGAQQRLTLIDVPTMLAATRVERVTEAQPANVQGKFRVQVGGGPARLSAACPHPSAAEALLLSGCALSARDVCHFERKLDSHASRRGVDPSEVAQMQSEFTRTYLGAGGALTDAARRFFRMRSLMGEITQLIKYEPAGMSSAMRQQLQQILDATDGTQFAPTTDECADGMR